MGEPSGGFEVLVAVAKANAEALEREWALLDGELDGEATREGIPVELWRALRRS